MERGQPEERDVKNWLRTTVAREIEELRAEEISADHATETGRGLLAWFAKYYVDNDPESLDFPDGSSDGAVDIASIISTDAETHIDVYQLSAPKLEAIALGNLVLTKAKFGDDVREFRNNVVGSAKRLKSLNATAQDVYRRINRARELASDPEDTFLPITIEIHPLSLRRSHPDSHREIDELAKEAQTSWSSRSERWVVHPIRDVFNLYTGYQQKRSGDEVPKELRLRIAGDVSVDHPSRGPFLCFVRVADLITAYDKWGAGILESNLRYGLGQTEVNKAIEAELSRLSAIKWFHEKNNGIVIVCNDCQRKDGEIRLLQPQVVNGGQTIYSITQAVRDIEDVPNENRSEDQKQRLTAIRDDLRLAARIVVVSGGAAAKVDDIAIASNTQNKLSERTMRSHSLEMRDLRLRLAGVSKPWYLVSKDGEWTAVKDNPRLFQSRTGNKKVQAFRRQNRPCRLENTDLGVAFLAFLGFVDEAKPSRVFKKRYFDVLFGSRPRSEAWQTLANRRIEWRGDAFNQLFEIGLVVPPLWLISYFAWDYWRTYTFPESRQRLMAYEEAAVRDPDFRKRWFKEDGWDVSDDARERLLKSSDSCYWVEQIAKSAYLVLIYQTMRILVRCLGALDEGTCTKILTLRQFDDLYEGTMLTRLGDFRSGSLSDGPLTSIGRILHYACLMLWQRYESIIRNMASRQQVFLQEEWIARFSEHTDLVCDRITQAPFRHAAQLEGSSDRDLVITSLRDLMGG